MFPNKERSIRLSDQCLLRGSCLYYALCNVAAIKNGEAEKKGIGSNSPVTTVHEPNNCTNEGNCKGFVITETRTI